MKDRSNEGKSGLGKPQVRIKVDKPGQDARKQSVLDVARKAKVASGLAND